MTKCVITGSHYRLWHLNEDLDIRVLINSLCGRLHIDSAKGIAQDGNTKKDVICTCKKAFAGKDLNTADCCNVQSP